MPSRQPQGEPSSGGEPGQQTRRPRLGRALKRGGQTPPPGQSLLTPRPEHGRGGWQCRRLLPGGREWVTQAREAPGVLSAPRGARPVSRATPPSVPSPDLPRSCSSCPWSPSHPDPRPGAPRLCQDPGQGPPLPAQPPSPSCHRTPRWADRAPSPLPSPGGLSRSLVHLWPGWS